MRRIKDGAPMTKVNSTAPVSQTGQTRVARKVSIPLIVMQQLTISTHKEAPLKFNFSACIPVPKNSRTPSAHFPDPNLQVGALHIKHPDGWAGSRSSDEARVDGPGRLPEKAVERYCAADD